VRAPRPVTLTTITFSFHSMPSVYSLDLSASLVELFLTPNLHSTHSSIESRSRPSNQPPCLTLQHHRNLSSISPLPPLYLPSITLLPPLYLFSTSSLPPLYFLSTSSLLPLYFLSTSSLPPFYLLSTSLLPPSAPPQLFLGFSECYLFLGVLFSAFSSS
jgi:hypothetical protein